MRAKGPGHGVPYGSDDDASHSFKNILGNLEASQRLEGTQQLIMLDTMYEYKFSGKVYMYGTYVRMFILSRLLKASLIPYIHR